MTETHQPQPHLYVDATLVVPQTVDARGTKTVVFGPFSDRAEAERTLTAVAGRASALGAIIRDPGGRR